MATKVTGISKSAFAEHREDLYFDEILINDKPAGGGSSTSVTWNVSSYSGTFYIAIGCYNNTGSGTASVSITKIKINS